MSDYVDLTDPLALALPAPEHGQRFYRDARQKGLALRVTAGGARAFVVLHWDAMRRRELRYTLGRPPALTVKAARKAVQARIGAAVVGRDDPFGREARQRHELTLQRVFDDYMAARPALKPRTRDDYRYRLNEAFSDWLPRSLPTITRDDVERRFDEVAQAISPNRARGAFAVLRLLFRFAMARYEVGGKPVVVDNPTLRLSATRRGWSRVTRRHSALPVELMPAFVRAALAQDSVVGDYLATVALTGMRRGEAARLLWQHVDLRGGWFAIDDTKNRDTLRLPITRQLRAIFMRRRSNSPYVFSTDGARPVHEPRKTLRAICRQIGHECTVHDLRRTYVTACDAAGLPALMTKALVGHRLPGGSGDVTAGYFAPSRQQLAVAAQRVADLIDGTTAAHLNAA